MAEPDVPKTSSNTEKDAAAVRIFPPGVPLGTVVAGAGLEWIWPVGLRLLPDGPLRYWLGGAIILGSIYFLGFRAVSMMRRSGQSENPYKTTTEIIEKGPYRLTRNPMYLQMVLICIGFAILLANIWIIVLTPVCSLLLHFLVILPEEEYLERKFGGKYLAYKKRVRRWI
ncbi:isoprenylcysteine carboxylmethyltransferase family protein [Sulfitobacter sp. SK011]|uniref:methyltransferase family protein n=1 Tax=Sulfitobacter sp. SK011 TaxID=1389004 RepID=UPI000E0B43E0|nr:isoprenylcysteine carboxylmethyltransferase family protein [Sulfitobacter sp. SK011]AXI42611.1 isoprenylcysteine carboxylmethyltransferase family protein [Sulfitobacter sp. SK011]